MSTGVYALKMTLSVVSSLPSFNVLQPLKTNLVMDIEIIREIKSGNTKVGGPLLEFAE